MKLCNNEKVEDSAKPVPQNKKAVASKFICFGVDYYLLNINGFFEGQDNFRLDMHTIEE